MNIHIMSIQLINMLTFAYVFVVIIAIVVVVVLIRKNIKKQYNDTIINLERNKNLIVSGMIVSELNKV